MHGKKRSEMCKKERKYGNIPSNSTRNSARINRIITDIKFSTFKIDTMDVELGEIPESFDVALHLGTLFSNNTIFL